jgi:hypothetical protein
MYATPGKHLRHARDHFQLLLDALDDRNKPCRVSYDVRKRNTPMESSCSAAIQALQDTIAKLKQLKVNDIDEELTLDAITPYPQVLKSSIGREVQVDKVLCSESHLTCIYSSGLAPFMLFITGPW